MTDKFIIVAFHSQNRFFNNIILNLAGSKEAIQIGSKQ